MWCPTIPSRNMEGLFFYYIKNKPVRKCCPVRPFTTNIAERLTEPRDLYGFHLTGLQKLQPWVRVMGGSCLFCSLGWGRGLAVFLSLQITPSSQVLFWGFNLPNCIVYNLFLEYLDSHDLTFWNNGLPTVTDTLIYQEFCSATLEVRKIR